MRLPNSTLVTYGVNARADRGGVYDPTLYAMRPRNRPVALGVPFYLPLPVTLTNTPNENATGQTSTNFNDDLLILGCETDLETSKVQFALEGTLPQIWSQFQVPVRTICGSPDTARPVFWWPYPQALRVGKRIQAQVLNVNGEGAAAGTEFNFIFNCAQPSLGPSGDRVQGIVGQNVLDPARLGNLQVIPIDSNFTGVAGEPTQNTIDTVDYDFLLQGFYSDLTNATIRIRDCERREWMSDFVPIWAVASRQSSQLNYQALRTQYLIPMQQMISVEFRNDDTTPESSGQLYMVGQMLLDL